MLHIESLKNISLSLVISTLQENTLLRIILETEITGKTAGNIFMVKLWRIYIFVRRQRKDEF